MKNFVAENWYKLMIGSSLCMASFGFMVHSLTSATAKTHANEPTYANLNMVPLNADGTISIKLTEEQLNRIVPKNEDGSINIRLSEQQLASIAPVDVQQVDIVAVGGKEAYVIPVSPFDTYGPHTLGVYDPYKR